MAKSRHRLLVLRQGETDSAAPRRRFAIRFWLQEQKSARTCRAYRQNVVELARHTPARDRGVGDQGQIAPTVFELEPNADRPNFLGFERVLLADEPAFVPRRLGKSDE